MTKWRDIQNRSYIVHPYINLILSIFINLIYFINVAI